MSFWQLFKHELMLVVSNRALMLTVVGGLCLYAFLYPRPYLAQSPREQSIVIINQDNSAISRRLERMVDASPLLEVDQSVASLEEAITQIRDGHVGGLLFIPKNFYRDLRLGSSPTLAFAGDASYFLIYGNVIEGLNLVSNDLAKQIKLQRLSSEGIPISPANDNIQAFSANNQAVFNSHQGYLDYVIPAVFLIILQQTLLIAVVLHSCSPLSRKSALSVDSSVKLVLVRTLIFTLLYVLMASFYQGFVLQHYDIHRWASAGQLLQLQLPYFLAIIGLSMCVASILNNGHNAMIIGLLTSLPIVFSSGFIWPIHSMPTMVNAIAELIPARSMVLANLKLNQQGASLSQITNHVQMLWLLAIGYLILGYLMTHWRKIRDQKLAASK
ncbi:ABC transporter permease [Alginatibacterium sediminis]|nr:ABC transporter permease [Alginatibacterium sediminis]